MSESVDQPNSGEAVRSLSDSDLQIILSNAIREGSFPPLDFRNCNDTDLAELSKMAEVKMNEVPAVQWEEVRKRTLLFTAVTRERASRASREAAQLTERADALEGRLVELGEQTQDMLVRANEGIAKLDGVISDAHQGVLDAGVAIARADASLAHIDRTLTDARVAGAEGRPVQGDVS